MNAWRGLHSAIFVIASSALWACAGGQKVPDWNIQAVGHVERFAEAALRGDARVEAREFELARAEVARTGRSELVARVELTRCATRVASLELAPCAGFEPLRADAGEPERAYADYLAGQAAAAQASLLPPPHRAIAAGGDAVAAIDDPLARLQAQRVDVQAFDFRYLRWDAGRAGRAALEQLAQEQSHPQAAQIGVDAIAGGDHQVETGMLQQP